MEASGMAHSEPKVSILCMTYNQAPYIKETLDGFLMQETDFPFEILIHDDASTDGTTEILRAYESSHPCIRVFYEEENQYLNLPAGDHFKVSLEPFARGTYIAQCEGDDYWIDPHKLQKQCDFMGSHPDYLCCGHGSVWITEDGSHEIEGSSYGSKPCDVTTDMAIENASMQTATLFYRRGLGQEFVEDWKLPGPVTDLPWLVWLCEHGKVRYDPAKLSAYRWLAQGSYSAQQGKEKLLRTYAGFIDLCNAVNEKTGGAYEALFRQRQREHAIGGASLAGFSFLREHDPDSKIRACFSPKDWLYVTLMQFKNKTWRKSDA